LDGSATQSAPKFRGGGKEKGITPEEQCSPLKAVEPRIRRSFELVQCSYPMWGERERTSVLYGSQKKKISKIKHSGEGLAHGPSKGIQGIREERCFGSRVRQTRKVGGHWRSMIEGEQNGGGTRLVVPDANKGERLGRNEKNWSHRQVARRNVGGVGRLNVKKRA